MAKTSIGLDENIAGLLCYLLGWITGIIFFLIEKENSFVRFHAMQSIIIFGGLFIVMMVIGVVPIIGWLIAFLLGILSFFLWIFLMFKAFQNDKFKLPVVGDMAEKYI